MPHDRASRGASVVLRAGRCRCSKKTGRSTVGDCAGGAAAVPNRSSHRSSCARAGGSGGGAGTFGAQAVATAGPGAGVGCEGGTGGGAAAVVFDL